MQSDITYERYDDYFKQGHSNGTDFNHNIKDNILKSVREQEAQFERLTRELEEERAKVAHRVRQYRIGSETESMNSISSTDDTFQWGGPQDESLRYGDESHGLMDSCLHELENRGTMQFGEVNMNYMDDQYGEGRGGPYSGDYNSYNGGPHHDPYPGAPQHDTSMHSSHVSLQSTGSNRNYPRAQLKLSNQNLGSRSSIPLDQHNDNYAPYSSLPQRNYEEYPGATIPSNGSPRGPGTPTRAPPVDDRYGGGPVEDSFYRQSPMLERQYAGGAPPQEGNYMDSPLGGVRPPYVDDSFQGEPDSFHAQPDSYQGQPNGYQGQPNYSGSQQMIDRYAEPVNDSYQDEPPRQLRHPDDGRYPEDDSYQGQDDSFRGPAPQEDRYREYPDDSYRGDPNDRYDDQPTNQSFQQNHPGNMPYGDEFYPEEDTRRHEGLPQVQDDPFADDPFRQKQRSLQHLQQVEDPYPRGPSPGAGSDRMGPSSLHDRPPGYDHMDNPEPPGRYFDDGLGQPQMNGYPEDEQGPPSINDGSMRWRSPDLQEVIDYLSHPSDAIKSNAAGYLTHLSYMDDNAKRKIRGLDGIPLLVDLLNSEYHEVHKNACGALKNLSYGRLNDENKRAVRNAGGIPALVRLLRKTQDEDVKDSVSGVLWNLSSCDDLKKPIIDDGLAVLVNVVIIPQSGWERRGLSPYQAQDSWTTTFRNATGVLRNVSSAGEEARRKLRECQGLVDSLVHTLRTAIDQNNVDTKPVQNCVCTLRNLAFRIQEVEDPDFYKKRDATLRRQKKQEKGTTTGCFGGGGKKKAGQKNKPVIDDMDQPKLPPTANNYRGLWGVDAVRFFLQLLTGSNPTMLEAACGAIQNLAACDWKPATEIRALVRKEKGLPSLVDLLTFEDERVVGAAATALRNLSIDERNKELVGKYAMKQLISNLPQANKPREVTDETVAAVLACLDEVIQHNVDFARSFCIEAGLPRLMFLLRNQEAFQPRPRKFAIAVAKTLWKFKVLHSEYQQKGYSEKDFNPTPITGSQPVSNYSTFNRQNQGYDDTTMTSRRGNGYPTNHMAGSNQRLHQGHSNQALDQRDMYGSKQAIPMNDISPPVGYAPIDEQDHRRKPPAGAVALFPNMMPGEQSEPLYAKVVKNRGHDDMGGPPSPNHMMGQQDGGPEGADSWV